MNQTTLKEVLEIASRGEYKLIPVARRILSDIRTPIETLRAMLNVDAHCFLLESAEENRQLGRYTFLGYKPTMTLTCTDHVMTITDAEGNVTTETVTHPQDVIRRIVAENKAARVEELPPFTGGLVGYFAYDYLRYAELTLPFPEKNPYGFRDLDLMLFEHLIVYDNLLQQIVLIANVHTDDIETSYKRAFARIDEMEDLIRHGKKKSCEAGKLLGDFTSAFSKEEYCKKVERTKDYILEGDIFQLVLSNPMSAPFEGSLLNAYRVLRTTNPSPYMFYFYGDDLEIAGASPETLVKVERGIVRTYPLAGTRRRGLSYEEDKQLEQELLADEKERAEHNMLVDLGRNDLGKISEFGTVVVEKYMQVERYSHVMHIASQVKGTLRADVKAIDAVSAILPAGTLSGAPKIRACEIIDELEGDRRGLYGGAIGYVDFTGNLDTCIAIRMAFRRNDRVFVRAGAGIVADSVPENEFEECRNKAAAVTEAITRAAEMDEP